MSVTISGQHAPHPWFTVKDDELVVAGRKISAIAAEVGRTPFYVYDKSVMNRKVEQLRAVLPKEIALNYAIKANPMPEVVRHMVSLTDGVDVASAQEMDVAISAGAQPQHVSLAGPGKTESELHSAAAAGITVHVESEREIRILNQYAKTTGYQTHIAIRVNPDFELKASGMKMGGGPKQFGIDAERVPQVLRDLTTTQLKFCGFHIYSGSQNLRPDSIVEAQTKTLNLAIELAKHAPTPVTHLNIGGGFGIPYFPGEQLLDLTPLQEHFQSLVCQARQSLPQAKLIIELGRYLVGEAGVYVCKVIDRKISRGQVYLVTDGGLHQHLAATGNFGQVIRKNYPVLIANRILSNKREIASVVGPLCTPLDLLADRMELAEAQEGDLVAVLQSGAYGFTASPGRFLSHPKCLELFL
jgi:diaminopimelate decarboxylase